MKNKLLSILFTSKILWSALLVICLMVSCVKDNVNDTVITDPPFYYYLVYDSLIVSVSLSDAQGINSLIGFSLNSQPGAQSLANIFQNKVIPNTKSGFKVFNIHYRTILPDSTPIIASGIIILPDSNKNPVKLAVYNHSSLSSLDDAPSNFKNFDLASGTGLEVTLMSQLIAPGGYAIACPDYIGYGLTSNVTETYAQKHLGVVCSDMISALKEFLAKEIINPVPIRFPFMDIQRAVLPVWLLIKFWNNENNSRFDILSVAQVLMQ